MSVFGRLHWQVFGTHLVVLSMVAALFGSVSYVYLRSAVDELIVADLSDTLDVTVVALEETLSSPDRARAVVERLARDTDVRVTVIRHDGDVIADSSIGAEVESMENHRDRPEVQGAFDIGRGVDRRVSNTLGVKFLYLARRVDTGDDAIVVRVAVPYAEVAARAAVLRVVLFAALLLALGLGAVLSFVVARRVTRPIAGLSEVAVAMGEGRFDVEMPPEPSGELAMLSRALADLRAQLAEKLREVEEEKTLLLTILGAMTEGVIVVDATGRVIIANPTALRLLGADDRWASERVEGRLLAEVTRNPRLINLVEDAIEYGRSGREEIEQSRGTRRHLGVSIAPLLEDDAVRGAVAVLYDLTQIRQLERVRQDFVANVSHELRTPIAAIRGWAETLTGGMVELPEFVEEQLLTILRHSERLGALVRDLLALARIETLGLEDSLVPVRLADVVDEVLSALSEVIESESVDVTVSIDEAAAYGMTEPRALDYVIRNLVENAIKYGGAKGHVTIELTRPSPGDLQVAVQDEGIGIEERHLPRIFERFYRIDKGRSRDVGGTGLGLSIVKHFATALGGEARVSSEVGRGSRFEVTFPAPPCTEADVVAREEGSGDYEAAESRAAT